MLHVSRFRVPGLIGAGAGVSVFWKSRAQSFLLAPTRDTFFPNTLCEEPPWLTVYIPALMKIFCTFSATRSASSSLMERHLLPAAPQQPPPSLVLTVGLEVRGRPSAACP